jgi:hypothetical protein
MVGLLYSVVELLEIGLLDEWEICHYLEVRGMNQHTGQETLIPVVCFRC